MKGFGDEWVLKVKLKIKNDHNHRRKHLKKIVLPSLKKIHMKRRNWTNSKLNKNLFKKLNSLNSQYIDTKYITLGKIAVLIRGCLHPKLFISDFFHNLWKLMYLNLILPVLVRVGFPLAFQCLFYIVYIHITRVGSQMNHEFKRVFP